MNRRLHTALTVTLSMGLLVSLIIWQKTQRQLQQQLRSVTHANGVLRGTLGDLTVVIAEKDKEIDRLFSACGRRESARPDSQPLPHSRNVQPLEQSHADVNAACGRVLQRDVTASDGARGRSGLAPVGETNSARGVLSVEHVPRQTDDK